ncbi:binding-protein-dependent transport systems inner membrane component [Xylanimonas cellulosilytica DSM 15894]|uniref:Binding-protein-dependent transport systems inner membrane component n=1 Tax=Xylanimonas cellulosilytica (strain DSM 15894 / JCM 12276 / CECT 5975 / KCTC 9989 / LMG 20990 / NBRC 107835 / XIL07) TaxID=446471 RepID=D1BUG5_XYLCX|nr:binding-protein-dependent transport systems inner membrane component [Xylanimonas cellulosilytica DSM 15894]
MASETVTSVDTQAIIEAERQKLRSRMKPGRYMRELGWRHVIGLAAVIYALFPIVFIISASLNPGGTMTGSNQLFSSIDLANYTALNETRFWTWFGNSLFISVTTAVGTVLMGAAAAYAFSRFRFTGRRIGLTALLVIQMFPQMLAFVAVFLLVMLIGQVFPSLGFNSSITLIAVYLGGALGVNTFLMYGFFNTIPTSLDEAAKIDGATHTQIYWTIILRLVAPILAVVGLLSFITSFGEYIIASLVLQAQGEWTLAIGLFNMVSDQLNANWGTFAAGAVISAVPVLILFQLLQKYIVGGLTAGSVKG